MRRKGLVKHPDLKMEQQAALDGIAIHNAREDEQQLLTDRNRRWYMLYHALGYTQAEIAALFNSKLPPDSPHRISEDAVEKAISRAQLNPIPA
jgi:hypothetical protein